MTALVPVDPTETEGDVEFDGKQIKMVKLDITVEDQKPEEFRGQLTLGFDTSAPLPVSLVNWPAVKSEGNVDSEDLTQLCQDGPAPVCDEASVPDGPVDPSVMSLECTRPEASCREDTLSSLQDWPAETTQGEGCPTRTSGFEDLQETRRTSRRPETGGVPQLEEAAPRPESPEERSKDRDGVMTFEAEEATLEVGGAGGECAGRRETLVTLREGTRDLHPSIPEEIQQMELEPIPEEAASMGAGEEDEVPSQVMLESRVPASPVPQHQELRPRAAASSSSAEASVARAVIRKGPGTSKRPLRSRGNAAMSAQETVGRRDKMLTRKSRMKPQVNSILKKGKTCPRAPPKNKRYQENHGEEDVAKMSSPTHQKYKSDGKRPRRQHPKTDQKRPRKDSHAQKDQQSESSGDTSQGSPHAPVDQEGTVCHQCNQKFACRSSLTRHNLVVHQGLKQHHCPHCQFRASEKSSLRIHIKIVHEGLKNYSCPYCEYKSGYSSHIKRHIASIHQRVKKHSCPQCDYKCVDMWRIKQHMQVVHNNIRNYICDRCGKKFSRQYNLNLHMQAIHQGSKNYSCDQCGYKSSYQWHLKGHKKRVHKCLKNQHVKEHKCPHCSYEGGSVLDMKQHIQLVHRIPIVRVQALPQSK